MRQSTTKRVAWSCLVPTPIDVLERTAPPNGGDWGWRVYGEIVAAERRIAARRARRRRLEFEAGASAFLDAVGA